MQAESYVKVLQDHLLVTIHDSFNGDPGACFFQLTNIACEITQTMDSLIYMFAMKVKQSNIMQIY